MSADDVGTEERKLVVAHTLGEAHGLTGAQRRVLKLVALGATRSEIGQETGTSVRTVKNHLEAIFDKLSARLERDRVARSRTGSWIRRSTTQ